MAFAQEAKLEGIRRTWSKMMVDFDGSREDCPLLADLSEAHGAYGEDDQRINGSKARNDKTGIPSIPSLSSDKDKDILRGQWSILSDMQS